MAPRLDRVSSGDGGSLGLIGDWAVAIMEALRGPGAGLLIAVENLFPPIPSEIILPLAGFAAGRGTMTLAEALIWTTVGSLVGALVVYGLARWLGEERTRGLVSKIPLVDAEDFDKAAAWFRRHGSKAIFLGRLVPLFRSFISLPAGTTKMPVWKFTLLTVLGSGIWNTIFVLAGFFLGSNWHIVERYADVFQWIVIAAVIAVVAWFVIRKLRSRRERTA